MLTDGGRPTAQSNDKRQMMMAMMVMIITMIMTMRMLQHSRSCTFVTMTYMQILFHHCHQHHHHRRRPPLIPMKMLQNNRSGTFAMTYMQILFHHCHQHHHHRRRGHHRHHLQPHHRHRCCIIQQRTHRITRVRDRRLCRCCRHSSPVNCCSSFFFGCCSCSLSCSCSCYGWFCY